MHQPASLHICCTYMLKRLYLNVRSDTYYIYTNTILHISYPRSLLNKKSNDREFTSARTRFSGLVFCIAISTPHIDAKGVNALLDLIERGAKTDRKKTLLGSNFRSARPLHDSVVSLAHKHVPPIWLVFFSYMIHACVVRCHCVNKTHIHTYVWIPTNATIYVHIYCIYHVYLFLLKPQRRLTKTIKFQTCSFIHRLCYVYVCVRRMSMSRFLK